MKRRWEYDDNLEPTFSSRRYIVLLGCSLLFFLGVLNLKMEDSYPGKLIQKQGTEYETYLSSLTLTKISRGTIFRQGEQEFSYHISKVEEVPMAAENQLFYLVTFQLEEEIPFPILSGKFMISKDTIFQKIKTIWEEKIQ